MHHHHLHIHLHEKMPPPKDSEHWGSPHGMLPNGTRMLQRCRAFWDGMALQPPGPLPAVGARLVCVFWVGGAAFAFTGCVCMPESAHTAFAMTSCTNMRTAPRTTHTHIRAPQHRRWQGWWSRGSPQQRQWAGPPCCPHRARNCSQTVQHRRCYPCTRQYPHCCW